MDSVDASDGTGRTPAGGTMTADSDRPFKATQAGTRRSYIIRCLDCDHDHERKLHPCDAGVSGIKIYCPECGTLRIHVLANHAEAKRYDLSEWE